MPHTITKTAYYFDELDEAAKQKALDWYREGALDYDWWDSTYEDAKTCLGFLGFEIADIRFSGCFSSQGDGASFKGTWSAANCHADKLKNHAPTDETLHRVADELAKIAAQCPETTASIAYGNGHYSHEFCTDIEVDDPIPEELFTKLARDCMRWIYRRLEEEYEYLMSDDVCGETILANKYRFTQKGNFIS